MTGGRRKRLHNPRTHKYYRVQQRTTSRRRAGQIAGPWHPKK